VLVLACSGFALSLPAKAGPAPNGNRGPSIDYTISGIRGTNGWYRGSRGGDFVVLRWTVRESAHVAIFTWGCEKEIIDGPTAGTTRTCTAWSDIGISSVTTELVKIDADPPRLGAIVVSSSERIVRLRWKAPCDAHFLLGRSPGRAGARSSVVYRGTRHSFADRTVKSGVTYRYKLRAIDQAGNAAAKTVRATPRPPLFAPAAGARLRSPRSILFAWEAVPQAGYFNLQLWLDGERILSAWPSRARFRLLAPWDDRGVRRDLQAGRYTWYVWAGRGPRNLGAYRPLLGSSTFFVAR
jgi:hypothetical protein